MFQQALHEPVLFRDPNSRLCGREIIKGTHQQLHTATTIWMIYSSAQNQESCCSVNNLSFIIFPLVLHREGCFQYPECKMVFRFSGRESAEVRWNRNTPPARDRKVLQTIFIFIVTAGFIGFAIMLKYEL